MSIHTNSRILNNINRVDIIYVIGRNDQDHTTYNVVRYGSTGPVEHGHKVQSYQAGRKEDKTEGMRQSRGVGMHNSFTRSLPLFLGKPQIFFSNLGKGQRTDSEKSHGVDTPDVPKVHAGQVRRGTQDKTG